MAIITVDQLKALNLGYLTGEDLLQFVAAAHLIKQMNVDSNCLLRGAGIAYGEVSNDLSTRYDITDELLKTGVINAVAAASQTAGIVTGIALTNPGIGYITAPAIAIVDPNGAGAVGVATLSGAKVNNIAVTAGGAGYTAPTVAITGGLGPDTRETVLVKIISIWAIRNALGNFEHLNDEMKAHFAWADQKVYDIRNSQSNLKLDSAAKCIASTAALVRARFRTLG